ncbi:MAG TPA: helix-turn-helix domain-containing protein [Rhizobiaceae bacterium]|nr:helix-turn-helix domain-containing protein [Rhizobiaceae bacterium]
MPVLQPFGVNETHGMLMQPTAQIRASSDDLRWTSLYVSVQKEAPFEGLFAPAKDQLIVLHRDGPVRIDRLCGAVGSHVVPPGGLHLIPAGQGFGLQLASLLETVHVYIRNAVMEEVSSEMVEGDPCHVEIPPEILDSDLCLHGLLEAAAGALDDFGAGSELFSDHLARAIASHLVRRYSGRRLRPIHSEGAGGPLSAPVLAAIEYMNDNIDQPISLYDIAKATNRSPSHIARLFRTELGQPPHRYLIRLRVEKARRLLEKTNGSIAEIAFECGFTHQEHLTRLFRREFSATPAAYRKSTRN